MTVFPNYYADFCCKADRCRHNCCIGWEIDVDAETASLYSRMEGALGDRLRANIAGDPPHFVLGAGERCPFLNERNLCDIITACGEEALCDICAMHPRFVNERGDRMELGLGMACEEAARLILTQEEPMRLVGSAPSDGVTDARDGAIALLQDRALSLSERLFALLHRFGAALPPCTATALAERFLALERLDEEWTERLNALAGRETLFTGGFAAYMGTRMIEYEQLCVYLCYRHMPKAETPRELPAYAALVAQCCALVYLLGAAEWEKNGEFSVEAQIELCRMFSAEIEYSDENIDTLLQAR